MNVNDVVGQQGAGSGGLDLFGAFRVLRRHWLIVLCFVVLVPAAALAYSLQATKEYQASASILFGQGPSQQQGASTSQLVTEFSTAPARVVATNIQLVSLPAVVRATAHAMGIPASTVKSEITIGAGAGDTDAVNVLATDPSPVRAANLANTYAQQYIDFRRHADIGVINVSKALILTELQRLGRKGANSPDGLQLQSEANKLNISAALQTGGAQLVQTAQPPNGPSSPNTFSNVLFGLLVGIVLGLAAALFRHRFDRRLHTPEQAVEIFERPLLATVPYARQMATNGAAPPASVSEAFYMLRANLRYFNFEGPRRTVMVTSPLPGDGKTSVVWSLGVAAARAGQKVLIVEADLRRPTLRRYVGAAVECPYGLVDVLTEAVTFEEAIVSVDLSDGRGESGTSMDFLFAGGIPPNPVDLVESAKMASVLDQAGATYDLVLVDTPPTAIVSDAIPILSHVDGVLVVCRLEQTTRPPALHLRDHLQNLNAPVLGVVANGVRPTRGYGGYGYYGYGQAYAPPAQTSDRTAAAGSSLAEPEPGVDKHAGNGNAGNGNAGDANTGNANTGNANTGNANPGNAEHAGNSAVAVADTESSVANSRDLSTAPNKTMRWLMRR